MRKWLTIAEYEPKKCGSKRQGTDPLSAISYHSASSSYPGTKRLNFSEFPNLTLNFDSEGNIIRNEKN